MADMTPGMALAKRLDVRFTRSADQVAAEREAREKADARRTEQTGDARQDSEARADRVASGEHKLDAEQRLRTQQLLIDLARADQDRQDTIDKARQGEEDVPPGSIYDLVV